MQAALDTYLLPEASTLAAELDRNTSPGFHRLNALVAELVDEWSMVSYAALDYSDEESIGDVLAQVIASLFLDKTLLTIHLSTDTISCCREILQEWHASLLCDLEL